MSETPRACERCGAEARVTILEGYSGDRPVFRELCFACADAAPELAVDAPDAPRRRYGAWTILLLAGVCLGTISVLGDLAASIGHVASGPGYWAALTVSGLLAVLGALFRVDIVGVAGAVFFALVLAARLFGITGSPGFGRAQQVGTLLGIALIALSVAVRAWKRRGYRFGRRKPAE